MNKTRLPSKFLAPKYWGTWIGIGLIRLFALFPYSWLRWFSKLIGPPLYYLARRRRHIIETNINLCFPEKSAAARKQLARDAFTSTIMAISEVAISWWGKKDNITKLHNVDGLEHLTAAINKNKGVILLVSHFTTMEIAGTFLNTHIDNLNVVYKRSTNPLLEWFIHHKRSYQNCAALIKHKNLREIVRSIKEGNVVWYAPDQDFGHKDSVFAPFMGIMTNTLVSTHKLAKITGAPVVPFYAERSKKMNSYTIHFSPELKNFPTDDDVLDATTINHAIEEQVRQTPEQYLWAHRRFKTRPLGEPDVYLKK